MAMHDPKTSGTTDQAASNPSTINPKDFTHSTDINNPYFPLEPGTTFVYKNDDGSTVDRETVTHRTKEIDGVKCVVVNDKVIENGSLTEQTFDYYAQDNKGTVWYFGEDAKQFEDGKLVGTEGSWRAGVNGAEPGKIMEADPKIGDSYIQENALPVAQDQAEVLSLDASASVPFGDFDSNVLLTLETSPIVEPGAAEVKYYAKGVGEVSERDLVTQEELDLVRVRHHGVAQLVQAMAGFGGRDPGLNTCPRLWPPTTRAFRSPGQACTPCLSLTPRGAAGAHRSAGGSRLRDAARQRLGSGDDRAGRCNRPRPRRPGDASAPARDRR